MSFNILSVSSITLLILYRKPFSLGLMISETPPTFEEITGVSQARLSNIVVGAPSNREVNIINLLML